MRNLLEKQTLSIGTRQLPSGLIAVDVQSDFNGYRKSQLYVNEERVGKTIEEFWKRVRSKTTKIESVSAFFNGIDHYDNMTDMYETPTFKIGKGKKKVQIGSDEHGSIPKDWEFELCGVFQPMQQSTPIKTFIEALDILSTKEVEDVMKVIKKSFSKKEYRCNALEVEY